MLLLSLLVASSTVALGPPGRLMGVTIDAAGRAVVVGRSGSADASSGRAIIGRYLPNGELDATFGTAGWVSAPALRHAAEHRDQFTDVRVDHEGRIVVVGHAGFDGQTLAVIARYTSSGRLDPSFANGDFTVGRGGAPYLGRAWIRSRPAELFHAVALDGLGRIVACGVSSDIRWGWRGPERQYQSLLVRFDGDGLRDQYRFGDHGVVLSRGDGERWSKRHRDDCIDLLLDPDGTVTMAGWVAALDPAGEGALLARFTPTGRLERFSLTDAPSAAGGKKEVYYDIARDPRGRIVTSGFSFDAGEAHVQALVVRRLPSGALDPSFGRGGVVLEAPQAASGSKEEYVMAHDVDARGRIVIVGSGEVQAFAARYLETGAVDPSFHPTGERPGFLRGHEAFEDVAIDGEGRAWIVGSSDGRTLVLLND